MTMTRAEGPGFQGRNKVRRLFPPEVCINAFDGEAEMKIKIESDKIIKAVKKLDGIEIVLENSEDAKEAIDLILRKTDVFTRDAYQQLKDVTVTSYRQYETSAVDYKMIFLLEFIFEDDVSLDMKTSVIKEVHQFFSKV